MQAYSHRYGRCRSSDVMESHSSGLPNPPLLVQIVRCDGVPYLALKGANVMYGTSSSDDLLPVHPVHSRSVMYVVTPTKADVAVHNH